MPKSALLSIINELVIEQVHEKSFELLTTVGVIIESERVADLLLANGCERKNGRITFSKELLDMVLDLPKPEVKVFSRTGRHGPTDHSSKFCTHNMGACAWIFDAKDGYRKCTTQDLVNSTKILDALENVTAITPLVYPQDIPQSIAQIQMVATVMQNTEKPLLGPGISSTKELHFIKDIATVVGHSETNNLLALGISPLSPLKFSFNDAELLYETACLGIPVSILPCPMAGLTAPITLIGSLVQQNAELLAGFTIVKLVNPNLPVLYAARLMFTNMQNCLSAAGIPDFGLAAACAVQLAHHYGLESDVYGLGTSSLISDEPCGYEKAVNGILPVLAGTDWLSGVGSMNNGASTSLEQLIFDNEILNYFYHLSRNIDFSEEAMATDVIRDVVSGQEYISHQHTFSYLRTSEVFNFARGLGNTLPSEEGLKPGAKTSMDKAREKVNEILKNHKVLPFDDYQQKEIDLILTKAAE